MEVNTVGLVSAVATFFSVWWGHVFVRKIEAVTVKLWLPMTITFTLGIFAEIIATRTENTQLSAAFGILGMVFLWDAFEFYRQQKRIKKGHAPANPNNPRHAQILKNYPAATIVDLLDREPRGDRYSDEEIKAIRGGTK